MHRFSELIERCVSFTLNSLQLIEDDAIATLQVSGSTEAVKTLQMINLEKTILVVGMFSIFEANLQNTLECTNGFSEAKAIIEEDNNALLLKKFVDLELAVNVLKHGKGRSYKAITTVQGQTIPSRIKKQEVFFHQGDISEIDTLIEVNNELIKNCLDVINQTCECISKIRPEIRT